MGLKNIVIVEGEQKASKCMAACISSPKYMNISVTNEIALQFRRGPRQEQLLSASFLAIRLGLVARGFALVFIEIRCLRTS